MCSAILATKTEAKGLRKSEAPKIIEIFRASENEPNARLGNDFQAISAVVETRMTTPANGSTPS
jgi:hypothetical protein